MSAEHPALGECAYCRAEIVWGSLASVLDRELSLCPACPPTPAARAALARGIADGRRSACSEADSPFTMPGHGFNAAWGGPEWVAAKRGWWAGHWTEQKDHALDGARASFLATLARRLAP